VPLVREVVPASGFGCHLHQVLINSLMRCYVDRAA